MNKSSEASTPTLRDDEQEPLYVFADPAGQPFCIFVAP
jgi:hypothetical protein